MPNNKQKGNNFERDMSRLLSLWWTKGKRDDAIWRSASSGALATIGKGRYLAHTGDFTATDAEAAPLFDKVIIEAKRGYSRFSVQDLLDVPATSRAKNPVYEMMAKLTEACSTQKKSGLLLWKRDRRDLLVFLITRSHDLICYIPKIQMISGNGHILYGMRWDDFVTISEICQKLVLGMPVSSSAALPWSPFSGLGGQRPT